MLLPLLYVVGRYCCVGRMLCMVGRLVLGTLSALVRAGEVSFYGKLFGGTRGLGGRWCVRTWLSGLPALPPLDVGGPEARHLSALRLFGARRTSSE